MRVYTLFELIREPARFERGKRFITDGIENGELAATVSNIFAFDEIVAAREYTESNQQLGKIVVTVS